MTDDSKNIAESVRSGRYFTEARAWYAAIYLSPVSGRTLFLIVAILASLVGLCAISALSSLLPLSSAPPILIKAIPGRMDEVIPRLIALNEPGNNSGESVNRFFVQVFVAASEGVEAEFLEGNIGFVTSHAEAAVADTVAQRLKQFQGLMGAQGKRKIRILRTDVDNDKAEGIGQATVRFVAYTEGTSIPSKTEWTAKLDYQYTALGVQTFVDEKTGEEKMTITDPKFQVVRYAVEEAR